jgi:peptide/nickel transport system permease protein
MANEIQITPNKETSHRVAEFKRFWKSFLGRGLVLFGAIVILIFIIIAIFGPWIAPYDPYEQDFTQTFAQPSLNHLLGTDAIGRDTLSRIIYGTRNSLMVGVVAVAIAGFVGMTLGLFAGYFGGITNSIIMRLTDMLMSFPMIILALLIASLLGGGLLNVMLALGIAMIPGYSRLMCSLVLLYKESDYVLAGRTLGSSNMRLMLRHIVPNCFPPLIVLVTIQIGIAILSEAALSYLGVGITPPAPAWGGMIQNGYLYLKTSPMLSFAPGIAIMLVVFAFNMVGDGLRDTLDPRLRGVL